MRRAEQDLASGEVLLSNMKANNGAKFGAFKPRNSLIREALDLPRSRAINTPLALNPGSTDRKSKKRNHRELDFGLDEEEDELAGPGVDYRSSSSPIKRQRTSISHRSSVEEYQRIEHILSPPNGLNKLHKASVDGKVDTLSQYGGTEREKRERKRQQTVLKYQKSKMDRSHTVSPYFLIDAEDLKDKQISSLPKPNDLHSSSSKTSPVITKADVSECLSTHSILFDKYTKDGEEADGPRTISPKNMKSPSSVPKTREHRASLGRRLLRKHEKCWPIKGFYTEKTSYEHGSIDLVIDNNTKMLSLRMDDKPQSERFPMDKIYEVKFFESLVRLHFRGHIAVMVWIRSRGSAENLVTQLQQIHNFQGKVEKRVEQMFAKWIQEREDRSSSPMKRSVEEFHEMLRRPSPDSPISATADRRQALLQQDLMEPGQNDDAPRPKRVKLSERLQASDTNVNGDSISITPARNRTKAAPMATASSLTDSKRSLRLNDKSRRSNLTQSVADPTKFSEEGTIIEKERRNQSRMQFKESGGSDRELGTIPTDGMESPALARATRMTRTKRPYADQDQPEKPSVVKFSKTHGLGPRWTEPLIWPRNGKKRVTVDFDDLERLDEEEFLNDNLVEFALRWLRREKNDPSNIYWFNTYFFEKISKGKGRQIDYNGVKKWTKDIDLFSYDYVVVPINENYHWYLVIICNLPRLKHKSRANEPDDGLKPVLENTEESSSSEGFVNLELLTRSIRLGSPATSPNQDKPVFDGSIDTIENPNTDETGLKAKEPSRNKGRTRDPLAPTIVTLDSLGFSHHQTIAILKSYLREEAQERLGLSWEKDEIGGMTAKGIPCQSNLSDCGLYLLGYVAAMLNDPGDFMSKLLRKEFDAEKDCGTLEPSNLRRELRKTIQSKHRSQVRRAAIASRDKVASGENSSDLSSDDIQLLEPENSAPMINGSEVFITTLPQPGVDKHHFEEDPATDDISSKRKSNKQTTHAGEPTMTSDTHHIRVKNYKRSDSTQEQNLGEVPETPQSTPGREMSQKDSNPGGGSSDRNDQQPVPQSTTPASSSSSSLRGVFRSFLGHS